MLVSYWLFMAYSLKTEAIDGTVTCNEFMKLMMLIILVSSYSILIHQGNIIIYQNIKLLLTNIRVHMYAPATTGRPIAVVPSGKDFS